MDPEPESARARRYLLGAASEADCSAIEAEYFQREEALDRMSAAEDDLIEDYLSDRLDADDRRRFARVYLSVPHRRRRVDTIRQLIAVASTPTAEAAASKPSLRWALSPPQWLGVAAALALAATASLWLLTPARTERAAVGGDQPSTTSPAATSSPTSAQPNQPTSSLPAQPQIFAVSISPVTVRSSTAIPNVVVAPEIDVVALGLETGGDVRRLPGGRGWIRTVSGKDIWQGPAAVDNLSPGLLARLDVPAKLLLVDDYVITLFELSEGGVEQERARYFMSVRAR